VAKRRIVKHGVDFVRHVVPRIIKPLHSLWNEVIGFLFLSLAFLGAMSAYRIYRHFDGSPETFFRLTLAAFFVLVMSYYGVSSFLKARKISRS
jgi:tryptophan-rich sensory protein